MRYSSTLIGMGMRYSLMSIVDPGVSGGSRELRRKSYRWVFLGEDPMRNLSDHGRSKLHMGGSWRKRINSDLKFIQTSSSSGSSSSDFYSNVKDKCTFILKDNHQQKQQQKNQSEKKIQY